MRTCPIFVNNPNNLTNIRSAIKVFYDLTHNSKFQISLPVFSDADFANAFFHALLTQANNKEYGAYCFEIISNIWAFSTDLSSPFTDEKFAKKVILMCNPEQMPDLFHYAVHAIANYCAISNEARNILLYQDIFPILLKYLKREQRINYVNSGLRLAINLILPGTEEIYEQVQHLLPILRIHIQHVNLEIRNKAAKCLLLILREDHIEDIIVNDIHIKLYESITHFGLRPIHLIRLANIFVDNGYDAEYITADFIQGLSTFLSELPNDDESLPLIFSLLGKIQTKVLQLLFDYDIINSIIEIALHGSFRNAKHATWFLMKLYPLLNAETQEQISANGAFEACLNLAGSIVGSSKYSFLLFNTIYNIIKLNEPRFIGVALDQDFDSVLNSLDIEDKDCLEIVNVLKQILAPHDEE